METHWDTFPITYRSREMKILAQWIASGEGGSVVGLPGCGRNNFLSFLCYRPEALKEYLPPGVGPIALAPVDLSHLPANDAATLYRVILRAFYWVRDRFQPEMADTVANLYRENRSSQDPFLSQSALHELLFAFRKQQARVVLVLNRFDRLYSVASPQVINTLRGLRDSFKETLCFIAGMPREVAYLPNPEALGDLYELLDFQVCWVGAMTEADARWVIEQATRSASRLPTEEETETMLALAGGFPMLLKIIGHRRLNNAADLPLSEWKRALTREPDINYRLTRLWGALTQEEQFALAAVIEWQSRIATTKKVKPELEGALATLTKEHGYTLRRLETKGVCRQTETGWQIKGKLLADYIKRVGPSSKGRIRIDEKTEIIYQGLAPLKLPPQEEKLLRFLIKYPYKRHSYLDLLHDIFAGEILIDKQGKPYVERGKESLYPIVLSLRKRIEIKPSEPSYIIQWGKGLKSGGYQFFPEGRPE